MCLSGCAEDRAPLALSVRVHTLANCGLFSDGERASLELQALGDFDPGNDSADVLPLDAADVPLQFPAATQAVLARTRHDGVVFSGYGERRADLGVDVLLWPEAQTCVVADGVYPGQNGGQALGFATAANRLLLAGGNDALDSRSIVGALTVDAGTGDVQQLDPTRADGMQQPRAFATATPFGSRFLVAGGQKPLDGVPDVDLELLGSAEIFDPARGGFSAELITLQNTRTHHAALTLEDGRTLLVGGRTRSGGTSIAQYQLELVDPETQRASVADAIAPRIDPVALRLSDGRIFVGGGTLLDGSLSAPAGEWLTREARRERTTLSSDVAPRFERAFVAMNDGALLAVGGCEDRPPSSDLDAQLCARCSSGCMPLDGWDAWWIDRQGVATSVALDGIAAPRPRLLPGSDGRPWLVAAATSSPEKPQLFRFNPWAQRFEPAGAPDAVRLPRPGAPAPLALAPDRFVWVDDDAGEGQLLGLHLGARSRYAKDLALVLQYDPSDPTRPLHLAPTSAPGTSVSYDGALTLSRPDVAVRVTDTDYADATIKLQVRGARLPRVLLGDSALGGADCPWPDGESRGGDFDLPTVVRRGTRAQLRFHGGESEPCSVPGGRLPLALVAGDGESIVTTLEVVRDAEP